MARSWARPRNNNYGKNRGYRTQDMVMLWLTGKDARLIARHFRVTPIAVGQRVKQYTTVSHPFALVRETYRD